MENYYDSGAHSVLARCVTAEVRARLAALRVSGRDFAAKLGMSQNYFATRLRDEKPFTLDDVELIVAAFDDPEESEPGFVATAYRNHSERIWADSDRMAEAPRGMDASAPVGKPDLAIAAHDEEVSIAGEQEQLNEP